MKHLILVLSSIIMFTGCTPKTLLTPCKTPNVEKAKVGKNELEYLNNLVIENAKLRKANEVCK